MTTRIDYRTLMREEPGRLDAGRALLDSLVEPGFVILTGHPVTADAYLEAHAAVSRLFGLPAEVKNRYTCTGFHESGARQPLLSGYALGDPLEDYGDTRDPTEVWGVVRERPDAVEKDLPVNRWPREVPELGEPALRLFRLLEQTASGVLRALSLALGEAENRLDGLCEGDGFALMKLLRYPPARANTPADALRFSPHFDFTFLSLWGGADAAGLELERSDGTWEAAPSGGEIVCGTGSMLAHITNGLLRPVRHRVAYGSTRGMRSSAPFVYGPRLTADLTPLEGCVRRTGRQSLPALTTLELLGTYQESR